MHKTTWLVIVFSIALSMFQVVNRAFAQESGDADLFELFEADDTSDPSDQSSGGDEQTTERPNASSDSANSAPRTYEDTVPVAGDGNQADRPTPRRRSGAPLEEIIVNAQRREEDIQDVAISITVFDQKQIANANMTNSADLANYTPSLQVNTRFGPDNASFTIRGFTQDLRTTASVGTYFAEVVAPRGQSTQTSGNGAGPGALFDLQNVQVLKGPQGTLFGRNTTGGAVLLVPNRPTDVLEGYAEVSGGNLDERRGQFVLNAPIGENLKVRFGLDSKEREGQLNNILGVGAERLGNVDYIAARLSAVWDMTASVENYSIVSITDSDTNGYTSQLFDCNNPLSDLADPNAYDVGELIAALPRLLMLEIDPLDLIPGVPLGSPFALLTFRPCQQQLDNQEAAGQNGFYDIASTVKTPTTQIEEQRYINTTTWDITDNLSFKNIVAYSRLYTENGSNIFGNYFPDPSDPSGAREFTIGISVVSPDVPVTSQETWVWEIQLQGLSFDNRLTWQAGAYYENSGPDGFSGNNAASLLYCDVGSIEGGPSDFNCFDPLGGLLGGVLSYQVKTDYLNRAVYTQGTYDFTPAFSSTLGLRYTWDETEAYGVKNLYRYVGTAQQAPEVTVQTPKVKSTAPTGVIEFNYRPWDSLMTYAKYTRGYRQGNTNTLADPGLDSHQPETVDTYEIGFKSTLDWPVPGRFNVAFFDNTLTDMQLQGGYISRTSGPTTAIFNAGKATSRGVEVEAFFRPFQFMTTSLSYSHLDTELVRSSDFCGRVQDVGFIEGFSCTPIADVGDELPYAPDHSYVASANFFLPLPLSVGMMNFGITYAYTGEQRVGASSQSPNAVLDDFGLLNMNLAWTGMFTKPLDLIVFATNITDEQYVTYVSSTYRTLGIDSRAVGLPRTIGARLRYSF